MNLQNVLIALSKNTPQERIFAKNIVKIISNLLNLCKFECF